MAAANKPARKKGKSGRKIGRAARKASNRTNARVHRDATYSNELQAWVATKVKV